MKVKQYITSRAHLAKREIVPSALAGAVFQQAFVSVQGVHIAVCRPRAVLGIGKEAVFDRDIAGTRDADSMGEEVDIGIIAGSAVGAEAEPSSFPLHRTSMLRRGRFHNGRALRHCSSCRRRPISSGVLLHSDGEVFHTGLLLQVSLFSGWRTRALSAA